MPRKVNDLLHNYLKRQMPHLLFNESSSLESMSSGKQHTPTICKHKFSFFHKFVADHSSHNTTTEVSSQGTWKPSGWYIVQKIRKKGKKDGKNKASSSC
jgi:hypothetical protein